MAIEARRTPCVGICSTTYGDLVCRGCKRFAHEIVGWNAYSDDQRTRVWNRLSAVRDGCVEQFVEVVDRARLDAAVVGLATDTSQLSASAAIYELLRRRARTIHALATVGLAARDASCRAPIDVRDAIDREFLARSRAIYERNFHTPVDG
jgi:predicted Fe-S protein YdhL (DUF1289 family)